MWSAGRNEVKEFYRASPSSGEPSASRCSNRRAASTDRGDQDRAAVGAEPLQGSWWSAPQISQPGSAPIRITRHGTPALRNARGRLDKLMPGTATASRGRHPDFGSAHEKRLDLKLFRRADSADAKFARIGAMLARAIEHYDRPLWIDTTLAGSRSPAGAIAAAIRAAVRSATARIGSSARCA